MGYGLTGLRLISATGIPRSGLLCCCWPYLELFAAICHVRSLYVCLPRSPQGVSLQAFLPVTFTATF